MSRRAANVPDGVTNESVQVSSLQDGDTLILQHGVEYGPIVVSQREWSGDDQGFYINAPGDYSGLVLVRSSYVVRKVNPIKVGTEVYDAVLRQCAKLTPEDRQLPGTVVAIDGDLAWVQWNRPTGMYATVRLSDLTRSPS